MFKFKFQVQDKGGNVVRSDSRSKILVEIVNNPVRAKLMPPDKTCMHVVDGVTNFTLLSLDRSGQQFRLAFHLYRYACFRVLEISNLKFEA
jgi:hypothetical protein